MVLLEHGADVSVINAEGHTAKSLTRNPEIIRLIEGKCFTVSLETLTSSSTNTPMYMYMSFRGYKIQ